MKGGSQESERQAEFRSQNPEVRIKAEITLTDFSFILTSDSRLSFRLLASAFHSDERLLG
jgi:hypothetical protein